MSFVVAPYLYGTMKYISIFFRSLHQKILELESKLEDSKGTVTPRLAGSREELELKLSGNFLHFLKLLGPFFSKFTGNV